MKELKISIGDWLDDGHGKVDFIHFKTNKSIEEIQEAYWSSCIKTGVAFHHEDYPDMSSYNNMSKNLELDKIKYRILTEYQNWNISLKVLEIFKLHGLNSDEMFEDYEHNEGDQPVYCPHELSKLILWFISLSLDDFEYKIIEDTVKSINGFWDKNLNVQFGYGIYE